MDDLVSIVVISYNSELTIMETLESIFRQTYNNIELVIADDGSQDNTTKIADLWVNKHINRFSGVQLLFSNQNFGITHNVNNGVKKACGKYIRLIAADDVLIENAIENLVNIQKSREDQVIFAKVLPFGSDERYCSYVKRTLENGYKIFDLPHDKLYKCMLKGNIISGPSGSFFTKALYEKLNYYDESIPMIEDYPFILKLLQNGYHFYLADIYTVKYRVSQKSTSGNTSISPYTDSWDALLNKVRLPALKKEKMYYDYLYFKVESYRYQLKKSSNRGIKYKLSIILDLFFPSYFFRKIVSKIRNTGR